MRRVFPWRGRISVGAADKTNACDGVINNFFGTASASDYAVAGSTVSYSGPAEWRFRRMILHYAALCKAAGGVDAFLIGSEMRGVTTARNHANTYPAIAQMIGLAGEVRTLLGPDVDISYGADWSEYFGHQPGDGSGDVFFHLDPFWADQNVDFIGIDNYVPLADWRDGDGHLDQAAGALSPYDLGYLQGNIRGGEGYEWYYASSSDRDQQIRTPITDGAYNEAWIYRYKDLWNWWSNPHHDRPGGVRAGTSTVWVPQSKPIRFTELGCPAVDKGANQPNVFVDPKSTESALPFYSTGDRDDRAQRRFLEAHGTYWNDVANNPVSSLYNGPMVDPDLQFVWAWDARPFPDFPARADVWGDFENWEKGHWLTGRLGRAPLDLLVDALGGQALIEAGRLDGTVTGYLVDQPRTARELIDPLADIFQFDAVETGGEIRFQPRGGVPALAVSGGDLVDNGDAQMALSYVQESELPAAFRLSFFDEGADFQPAAIEARQPGSLVDRAVAASAPIVLQAGEAEARARSILADAWVMRERLSLSLPPSYLALEPGDVLSVDTGAGGRDYRIVEITDREMRSLELVRVLDDVYRSPQGALQFRSGEQQAVYGQPSWALLDLPRFTDTQNAGAPWFAAFADPWPGGVSLYRNSLSGGAPVLSAVSTARASMGRLTSALPAGFSGRIDERAFSVGLTFGSLSSVSEEEMFNGANLCAVQSANGRYELLQFRDAVLQPNGGWVLSGLLRGQFGGEVEARAGASNGARFVLINAALVQVSGDVDLREVEFVWQAGPDSDQPGSENFAAQTLSLSQRGDEPLSPVHPRARRDNNDIRLSWIRRGRVNGDSWVGEIPLGENSERYVLTIFNGGSAVRNVETTAPSYLYSAAQMSADFGVNGPGDTIEIEIAQLSDSVGAGAVVRATLPITP